QRRISDLACQSVRGLARAVLGSGRQQSRNGNPVPLYKGEVIMVWSFLRVAIFTISFIIGLLVFGSGGSSAASKVDQPQFVRGTVRLKCVDSKMVMLRTVGL